MYKFSSLLAIGIAALAFGHSALADKNVKVEIKGDPAKVEAGKVAEFELIVTPLGKFHMNQEAPATIKIKSPDKEKAEPAQEKWKKEDAIHYKDEEARWKLPVKIKKAGKHELEMSARFVICIEELCKPIMHKQKLTVEAK